MSSTTEANSVDASRANMTIGAGRSLARAKGTGYQIMDAAMQIFWRDLACACFGAINFNSGAGVASYLGLKRMTDGGWWILHKIVVLYTIQVNQASMWINQVLLVLVIQH